MQSKRRDYYFRWWNQIAKKHGIDQYLTEKAQKCIKSNEACVYEIAFIYEENRVSAYIGESLDLGTRLISHMKRFFGNTDYDSSCYWNGIPRELFQEGEVKIDFNILAQEKDLVERLSIEEEMVDKYTPFLQDSCQGLFPKYYKDGRNDLCIIPFNEVRNRAWENKKQKVGLS